MISPQALMFYPNSPGTHTMEVYDSLPSVCNGADRSISDFETNTEKSGYLYLPGKLLCFVGDPHGEVEWQVG
jgi:hypothetical protein